MSSDSDDDHASVNSAVLRWCLHRWHKAARAESLRWRFVLAGGVGDVLKRQRALKLWRAHTQLRRQQRHSLSVAVRTFELATLRVTLHRWRRVAMQRTAAERMAAVLQAAVSRWRTAAAFVAWQHHTRDCQRKVALSVAVTHFQQRVLPAVWLRAWALRSHSRSSLRTRFAAAAQRSRLRTLRATFSQWRDNVDVEHRERAYGYLADAHARQALLKRCLRQWVRAGAAMPVADATTTRLRLALQRWRNAATQLRSDHHTEARAAVHYQRRLLSVVFTGWASLCAARAAAGQPAQLAAFFRQRALLRGTFTLWVQRTQQARAKRIQFAAAERWWQLKQQAAAVGIWRAWARDREAAARAAAFAARNAQHRCFSAWAIHVQLRKQRVSRILAAAHAVDLHRLRVAVQRWRHRTQDQQSDAALTLQAVQHYRQRQLRLTLRHWSVVTRLSVRESLCNSIAMRHWQQKMRSCVLHSWRKWAARHAQLAAAAAKVQHAREQRVRLTAFAAIQQVAAAAAAAKAAEDGRVAAARAVLHRLHLARVFGAWKTAHATQLKRAIAMSLARARHHRSLTRRVWAAWQRYVSHRRARAVESAAADRFNTVRLLWHGLQRWKAAYAVTQQLQQVEYAAAAYASSRLLRRVFSAWAAHTSQRQRLAAAFLEHARFSALAGAAASGHGRNLSGKESALRRWDALSRTINAVSLQQEAAGSRESRATAAWLRAPEPQRLPAPPARPMLATPPGGDENIDPFAASLQLLESAKAGLRARAVSVVPPPPPPPRSDASDAAGPSSHQQQPMQFSLSTPSAMSSVTAAGKADNEWQSVQEKQIRPPLPLPLPLSPLRQVTQQQQQVTGSANGSSSSRKRPSPRPLAPDILPELNSHSSSMPAAAAAADAAQTQPLWEQHQYYQQQAADEQAEAEAEVEQEAEEQASAVAEAALAALHQRIALVQHLLHLRLQQEDGEIQAQQLEQQLEQEEAHRELMSGAADSMHW